MSQPPAAPQSIGGVLDSGFRVYRLCLGGTFLLAAVSALLSGASGRSLQAAGTTSGALFIALLLTAMGLVLMLAFYGAIIARIDAAARGAQLSIGASLAVGWRRAPALFAASVLYFLLVVAGLLLLIVPGVLLSVALAFTFYAAILEGTGPVASLRYSWRLVRGHWWRTAALLVTIFLLVGVLYLVGAMLVGTLTAIIDGGVPNDGALPWYVDFVALPLLAGLLVPLLYALSMAAYRDLQLRHEGADLAERIAAADA